MMLGQGTRGRRNQKGLNRRFGIRSLHGGIHLDPTPTPALAGRSLGGLTGSAFDDFEGSEQAVGNFGRS